MNEKKMGRIPDMLEIALGMKAMVMINITTESDLANGTRGTIEDLILDPREPMPKLDNDNVVELMYLPALILQAIESEQCPNVQRDRDWAAAYSSH